ncbi:RNA recognition domain-containing protein [Apiospora arundinis]|uniref:RNA recognition domain-containing protein n=1 Tax=Apiospora arundinis TaxID=335852 RepID=A0ABR2JH62_9PEZI
MSSSNNLGRAASADIIGNGSQRLMRTASARETGSPGIMSNASSSDGGASLGARMGHMTLEQPIAATRPSFAEVLGVTDAPQALDFPLGMIDRDEDPFSGHKPHHYTREPRQREARRRRPSYGTVDAQEFYPASACVFVANLPESMDNVKLERELNDSFGEFGAVFIKIRRDKDNMPFAFCQYTNDKDAALAMAKGAGMVFQNRPCRTEMVRANRTFILRNYVGGEVSLEEARSVLQQFGAIGRLEEVSSDIADSIGIHQGILVEFKNYDPNRDIQAAFRHHAYYRVAAHDVHRARRAKPTTNSDQAYLRRYDIDARSIFIGNLPDDCSGLEREVRNLAGEVGRVLNVQVIRKEGRPGYGLNVFAFVEFESATIAELAAQDLSGRRVDGSRIRVERKETREPGSDRRGRMMEQAFRTTTARMGDSPVRHRSARDLYTPRRVETAGNEASGITSGAPVTMPVAGYPAWFHYGSPNYTTAPYMAPPGMDAQMPPNPYYLPASMAWAAPYMHDPSMAQAAYWVALDNAHRSPAFVSPGNHAVSEEERHHITNQPRSEDA